MESVNVLASTAMRGVITFHLSAESLQQIAAVSSKIKVTDISDLLRAEQAGELTPAAKEKLDALLAETEVLFGLRFPQNYLVRAPKLKWVQCMSAGVNMFLDTEMVESPVILTSIKGMQAVPISEFIIGLMLAFVKQTPLYFQFKQEKRWDRRAGTTLRSKTVGIVGLGHIGREVARLTKAFGMRVLAVDPVAGERARYVDVMSPPDQLPRLLEESDFVVLALALTPETNKLIGEKELRAMKPTAYLINTSRGPIVDEEALIRALDEHWIAGAGLDVFATEPLPTDSRLWELPNVILSPHISFGGGDYVGEATKIFVENLRRYLNNKKLLRVVNKKKGW